MEAGGRGSVNMEVVELLLADRADETSVENGTADYVRVSNVRNCY